MLYFQNPENLPVERLTLSVSDAGVLRKIKALVSGLSIFLLNNLVQYSVAVCIFIKATDGPRFGIGAIFNKTILAP